jgi:3-oxoacyl-(acyl-carrier-protein) synthase
MEKVFIRGRSIICSLGDDIDTIITRVRNKECKTVNLPIHIASLNYTRPYYRIPGEEKETLFDLDRHFYDILFNTVSRAIQDSGLSNAEVENSALFFGSTSIDMPMIEWPYKKARENGTTKLTDESPGYGKIISQVSEHFNIKGPCYTFTTACTSSANCLLYASSMIKTGHIERAIVIGYDLYNELGFYGFESLKLIEPGAYKPFDKNRIGIIMGEGCGAVVLDRRRKTEHDFVFLGGSNACDTFNVTTHNVQGDEIASVILEALKNCNLTVNEIDAVKAHATGSPINDVTEYNGMKLAFGDRMPPFSGIKPYVGHTVGASGVIELILIAESIARGFFPPTPGFKEVDEEINARPITEEMKIDKGNFMLNFFGFGGNCTSFIISNKA